MRVDIVTLQWDVPFLRRYGCRVFGISVTQLEAATTAALPEPNVEQLDYVMECEEEQKRNLSRTVPTPSSAAMVQNVEQNVQHHNLLYHRPWGRNATPVTILAEAFATFQRDAGNPNILVEDPEFIDAVLNLSMEMSAFYMNEAARTAKFMLFLQTIFAHETVHVGPVIPLSDQSMSDSGVTAKDPKGRNIPLAIVEVKNEIGEEVSTLNLRSILTKSLQERASVIPRHNHSCFTGDGSALRSAVRMTDCQTFLSSSLQWLAIS